MASGRYTLDIKKSRQSGRDTSLNPWVKNRNLTGRQNYYLEGKDGRKELKRLPAVGRWRQKKSINRPKKKSEVTNNIWDSSHDLRECEGVLEEVHNCICLTTAEIRHYWARNSSSLVNSDFKQIQKYFARFLWKTTATLRSYSNNYLLFLMFYGKRII